MVKDTLSEGLINIAKGLLVYWRGEWVCKGREEW